MLTQLARIAAQLERSRSHTLALGALLGIFCACSDRNEPSPPPGPSCAEIDPSAAPRNVGGNYRYLGELRGLITLEQADSTVRLVKTTYDNADDRPLVGEGTLHGNFLDMLLVPENGDPDYKALVRFVFDETSDRFCVQFSDTNDDHGPLGSYTGTRQ
jgi:hypothetical protein